MIEFLKSVSLFLIVGPIVVDGIIDVVKVAASIFDPNEEEGKTQ